MKKTKIIISGGGTGGHIFPAISIANAITAKNNNTEILFIGAKGRMEMKQIPEAGYKILGLPIQGFDRKNILNNIKVVFLLIKSLLKANLLINRFKPDIAIGVGGYASGPTLKIASLKRIPTLIQEQNSYAGVTNKLLAKSATKICVAYKGMERFFPEKKIILTGNPIRGNLKSSISKEEAIKEFGLNPKKKTILILGGSLGAMSINNCLLNNIRKIQNSNYQIIWQTGKLYHKTITDRLRENKDDTSMIHVCDFISKMPIAYKAADLIISRAGAGSISEFCMLNKAVILIPSPNVSEDHQTKNAEALIKENAALMVKDSNANKDLVDLMLKTINDTETILMLERNIGKLAFNNSADIIAEEVFKIINKK